ncbi:MAG TPA: universal stress protein [Burkholderiaceae bacterium]|nr:universal stress protein [Burkholderiaceae bacterium]
MYERILVPIDGSPTSQRGLAEALAVAGKFGSTVRLLHVVDDATVTATAGVMAGNVGDLLALLAEGGQKILEQAKSEARSRGVAVETVMHNTMSGRVCDVVVKEASDWKADLIVIGTHGRRGAGRLFLGSDAEQVLRLAPVPVLLVRAPGAKG